MRLLHNTSNEHSLVSKNTKEVPNKEADSQSVVHQKTNGHPISDGVDAPARLKRHNAVALVTGDTGTSNDNQNKKPSPDKKISFGSNLSEKLTYSIKGALAEVSLKKKAATPKGDDTRTPSPGAPEDTTWKDLNTDDKSFYDSAFSLQNKDIKDKQIDAWRQTTTSNCASTAWIKAGMEKYGTGLFDKMTKTSDGIALQMKDGVAVELSTKELQRARKASGYISENGDDKGNLAFANIAYAAMGKRAAMAGNEGAKNFKGGLKSLGDGEEILDAAAFLGLKDKVREANPKNFQGDGFASSESHAIFVDKIGNKVLGDNYGTAEKYGRKDYVGSGSAHRLKWAYTLVD